MRAYVCRIVPRIVVLPSASPQPAWPACRLFRLRQATEARRKTRNQRGQSTLTIDELRYSRNRQLDELTANQREPLPVATVAPVRESPDAENSCRGDNRRTAIAASEQPTIVDVWATNRPKGSSVEQLHMEVVVPGLQVYPELLTSLK